MPSFVRSYGPDDVAAQNVYWSASQFWRKALRDHACLLRELEAEVGQHGRLRREFVSGFADGETS
jgi:hypothetical protein